MTINENSSVAKHPTRTRLTTRLEDLVAGLRVWAKGLLCLEAAVELLIGHELWLWREDFAHAAALGFGWHVFTGQAMVWLDFIAAGHALESGVLPCSSSERQLLLIAASIAEGRPVDLREALSGLDETDTGLVVRAVVHAAGHGGAVIAGAPR